MRCFFGVTVVDIDGGGINFCRVFAISLFCDKSLTGETPHSAEFLCEIQIICIVYLYHRVLRGPNVSCVVRAQSIEVWPRGYKTFFMLNSTEHEMFLLIKVQRPKIVGILTFMSEKNSILGLSKPKKSRFFL